MKREKERQWKSKVRQRKNGEVEKAREWRGKENEEEERGRESQRMER